MITKTFDDICIIGWKEMVVLSEKDRVLLQEAAKILEKVERDHPEDEVVYTDTLSRTISMSTNDPLREIALFTICTAMETMLHTHEGPLH